jgi:hypothetical protein
MEPDEESSRKDRFGCERKEQACTSTGGEEISSKKVPSEDLSKNQLRKKRLLLSFEDEEEDTSIEDEGSLR